MSFPIGIDALSLYTPAFSLPLQRLAEARGVDPNKYLVGLGQEEMSILPPDEDIVSMGANAARKIVTSDIIGSIKLLMFATETGVDQSKSAGLWVHSLLQLSKTCRVIEVKQACYSATCALKLASSYVREHPDDRVLIIASDNARYGFRTPGEPTQGCGASAFLISRNPKLVALEKHEGISSEHIMDFWRPNYMTEAIVDGKLSTRAYLQSLTTSWQDYLQKSGRTYEMHSRFCYHLPFTKMAEKAHDKLIKIQSTLPSSHCSTDTLLSSLLYSKKIGNGYTASLYIGLASLLENDPEDLSHHRIGFFSYGSGCTSEFFSGMVQENYKEYIAPDTHKKMIAERRSLSCEEYEEFFSYQLPKDGQIHMTPSFSSGCFRLKGISQHERLYE